MNQLSGATVARRQLELTLMLQLSWGMISDERGLGNIESEN